MSRMTSRIIVSQMTSRVRWICWGPLTASMQSYKAASRLPTVRTPSQIKKFYEPVIETDGVDVMEKSYQAKPKFDLPDFSKKKPVSATEIGSAVHELMQRLRLSQKVASSDIEATLSELSVSDEVKARIQTEKILTFFEETPSGASYPRKRQIRFTARPRLPCSRKILKARKNLSCVGLSTATSYLMTASSFLITRLINSLIQKISSNIRRSNVTLCRSPQ